MLLNKNQENTIKSYDISAKEFIEKIALLNNYNNTYDYLIKILKENDNILDLACGPAQISKYIKDRINVNITGVDLSNEMLKIANKNIPDGVFTNESIITYNSKINYNLIIIGFGIPYLNKEQTIKCIQNSITMLKNNGHIYISFMDGNKEGFEKTSFGKDNEFYIYYHKKEEIENILENNGIKIKKKYELKYNEMDGKITKDIILIGEKT
ncbi:MAG: class I SAM-dependent methyltransferase [Chitinispirillales bacterium]|jgi:predicted TPR repeat methyltransferase|nr:class I SAM-dependent methyltransferase [Chitinispirillales bacterium]